MDHAAAQATNDTAMSIIIGTAGALILLLISALFFFIKGKFKKLDVTADAVIRIEKSQLKTEMHLSGFGDQCLLKHKDVERRIGEHDYQLNDHEQRIKIIELRTQT